MAQDSAKSYKDTLNLPRTDFPIRPNAKEDDPKLIKRWSDENLFSKSFDQNKGKKKYVLHDGPPYANGPIHLGHAYNKILKDIVSKSRRMAGCHTPVRPGWDCHGLPIEQKVVKENPGLSRLDLMTACRKYAANWIEVQKESFRKLGVLMDWNNPYITMNPMYEADTVRAFGILVKNGFIERKNKTVPWCPTDQTVLAAAEIEYADRKDPSVYVLFKMAQKDQKRLFGEFDNPISVLVWTTTPWTLPLNRAVAIKPNEKYSLLDINGTLCIIGSQAADKLLAVMKAEKKVLKEFDSSILKDVKLNHPIIEGRETPIIFDESVIVNDGTAAVHIAPGCGPQDYEIGVKNNLEIYSPVTADGKYAQEIEPKELEGMLVSDGQIWVIKKLHELGNLFFKNSITHSYPHCWRCRNGLIFRATAQWFFNLDQQNVKQKALEVIENIKFVPAQGKSFLRATVESRWEWCLSRQRVWGTPMPALVCKTCDHVFTSHEFINKIADGIEKEGIEYWAKVDLKDVLEKNTSCPKCNKTDFEKEYDILDVWFDAGVSHFAVLEKDSNLAFPADLYLEGLDQYRGWFQSSLLTSLVLEQKPCMKAIMTHGYTVDAQGRKMSKSLGNVIAPEDLVVKLGTDGLRLWAASIGNDRDPVVSDILVQNVAEVYRKIRNTQRFLLSNLFDFDFEKNKIKSEDLLPIDQYALVRLHQLNREVLKYYEEYNITSVFHKLSDYCTVDLSAFYLDIIKDRLYVERADGLERRSAQTACFYILDTLTKLTAPILSFTAELVSDEYQKDKKESIHLQNFVDTTYSDETELENAWRVLYEIRDVVLKAIEVERVNGVIKHPYEARVQLFVDSKVNNFKDFSGYLEKLKSKGTLEAFFKEFLIVSQFELLSDAGSSGITATVLPAQGTKCPRCWRYDTASNSDGLCSRCSAIV